MTPTETLKHEHQVISLALQGAEEEAQRIGDKGVVHAELTGKLVDFFLNFVDRCHHAKEERHLFPKMRERGGPAQGDLIDRLLREHDEARGLVKTIAGALPKAVSGETEPIHILGDSLRAYARLLRAHMDQENELLFAMADETLTQHDADLLTMEFERVEQEEIGAGAHERYLHVAHGLAHEAG
jgi:hemerythrin-like domain-containing protein